MSLTQLRIGLAVLLAVLSATTRARANSGHDRMLAHTPKMSYLDNGVVKVGVDLNLGGAITYLSASGTSQNLINSYDFGRQIQMSYYSGPIPFKVPGRKLSPDWTGIGWNPIQTGDAFGNASTVLETSNDGKKLYVRCVPMHWPLENVPGEGTVEWWLELEGPVVHVSAKLLNQRPDHTQYPARAQELPAVYTNGPWHRLMSYVGDRPFSGDGISQVKKRPEEAMWADFMATECWAALVNDDDFSLGVYVPGIRSFGGGFAGTPGAGGPDDDPTGYIAPHPTEVIDWNIEYKSRFDLIVGKLPAIRDYVYAHERKASPPVFTFDATRCGWSYVNAIDTGWPIGNELKVQLEKNDPQLHGPVQLWQAEDADAVVIEAALHSARSDAVLFWRGPRDSFSEERSVAFVLNNDGGFHSCRVDLKGLKGWTGAISQIRFDPIGAGQAGECIAIRSIRFQK